MHWRGNQTLTRTGYPGRQRSARARGGKGSAKPYQKSASRGIVATASTAPVRQPRQSSQPPHDTISIPPYIRNKLNSHGNRPARSR
jgi:hypothetical protein